MKYLQYDERGDVVGCHDVVPIDVMDSVVEVEPEYAAIVLENPKRYHVVAGKVERREVVAAMQTKRIDYRLLDNGVMIDGVCYATNAHALAILSAQTENFKAIVHTASKDILVEVDKKLRRKIVDAVIKKIEDSL